MTAAGDYFARVRPLLGKGLSEHVVAIDGDLEAARLVVELLASSMLQTVVGAPELAELAPPCAPLNVIANAPRVDARIVARRGVRPSASWSAALREVAITVDPTYPLASMDVAYHVARTLRDALLRGDPWPDGAHAYGPAAWPFLPVAVDRTPEIDRQRPPYDALRDKHVAIVGCGSLGSEAARALAGRGARWTLVDDAVVTVFNLARQWYEPGDVGCPKVHALAERLGGARAWRARLGADGLPAFERMVRTDPPDVVLLATGTHHHTAIAELLWRLGIPHAAACCYPQARFFEIAIVSPRERTPCLSCFRGHLYRGAPEPAPMTDEIAQLLYRPMDDAQRERAYTDLVAEPATRIETMRAAEVLARCALELCATRRSAWFERVLAASTTCLLGGNVAVPFADGGFAYGIHRPGQVIRLGLEDIAGVGDVTSCDTCQRRMTVALRESPVSS